MEEEKKEYQEPELRVYGELRQLTLGSGGSSFDGTKTFTQQGSGNDGSGPPF